MHGFEFLTAFCGPTPSLGSLVLALLLAGLAGSTMHCVPMCGGFVLGQVADKAARVPVARLCEWHRIGCGMLLAYHLGRLTTYAGLGAMSGLVGGAVARLPWFGFASTALLLIGALLFLSYALRRLMPKTARKLSIFERAPAGWHRAILGFIRHVGSNGYWLGLALGFLPCGFLYAALVTAAASSSPVFGALSMLAFGLGTAPALIVLGIAGHAASRHWQSIVTTVSPAVMLLNAALLGTLPLRGLVVDM